MATHPDLAAAPQPSHLEGVGQRRDSFFTNYESLWAKLWRLDTKITQVEEEPAGEPSVKATILRQCRKNLSEARSCLEHHKETLFMRPTSSQLFWRLAHQIDEDLLLIMPRKMLATEAAQVVEVFRRNIPDKALRESWLGKDEESGPLSKAVKSISAQHAEPTQEERIVLQGALHAVNEQTDRQFEQAATNTIFQVLSGMILLVLLIVIGLLIGLNLGPLSKLDPKELSAAGRLVPLLMVLGAAGAILSNMMTRDPFVTPAGQAGRFFMYHLIGKPVLGATAALFFFFLVQSGWLFDIRSTGSPDPGRPIQITVADKTAVYFTHFLLAFVVGFAAERLLRRFIDKVIESILKQAEKSEVSKAPGAAATAPA